VSASLANWKKGELFILADRSPQKCPGCSTANLASPANKRADSIGMAPPDRPKHIPSVLRRYQLSLLAGVSTAVLAGSIEPVLAQAVAEGDVVPSPLSPNVTELLVVGQTNEGTLTVTGKFTTRGGIVLGQDSDAEGTAIVTGTDGWWINYAENLFGKDTTFIIGDQGKGVLRIEDEGFFQHGPELQTSDIDIARGDRSYGKITVTDQYSYFYSTDGSELRFGVGDGSKGYIEILNGAYAETGSPMLGYGKAGYGEAIVSGGGYWDIWNTAYVGYAGEGYLEISNGEVSLDHGGPTSSLLVGYEETGDGTVKVSDGGILKVGADLNVGQAGTGTMMIQSGGKVSSNQGAVGLLGGSSGYVSITGNGSSWTLNGELNIGGWGGDSGNGKTAKGTVEVTEQGSLMSGNLYIGAGPKAEGALIVSKGGTVNANDLDIGRTSEGQMTISEGGKVENSRSSIGFGADSAGKVTVTGEETIWSLSFLAVGYFGEGHLTIEDRGKVESAEGYLGFDDGSIGTVVVAGSDEKGNRSTWKLSNKLYIGGSDEGKGEGHLIIEEGGLVDVQNALDVGRNGVGSLEIKSGGAAKSKSSTIGYETGSEGTVTISGTNSIWQVSGSLFVGGYQNNRGTGHLTISSGGR
jgi:T5SS/PEP-CTERM-associated repeat protein